MNGRRKPGRGNLSASQKQRNRRNSRVRARVAHLFRIIKCQFEYRKVRYKGLAKNRAQVMSLVALANISIALVVDGLLTGEVRLKAQKE